MASTGHSGIIRGEEERSNWTGDSRQNLHIRAVYPEDWRYGLFATEVNVNIHSMMIVTCEVSAAVIVKNS